MRCLIKHWREQSIKILVYLDDGFGCEHNQTLAEKHSIKVKSDLTKAGFIINYDKSVWQPHKRGVWLGVGYDLNNDILFIPNAKIENIKNLITLYLKRGRASARQLAEITGKLNAMHVVLSNMSKFMTKYMHTDIDKRNTWDVFFKFSEGTFGELMFWLNNIERLKAIKMRLTLKTTRIVYSDASSVGCGGFIVGIDDSKVFRAWDRVEACKSSTWRELYGVLTVVTSVAHLLKGQIIKWYTDNKSVVSIVQSGSMNSDLHDIALKIFNFSISNDIKIEIEWIPRSLNDKADYISKLIDPDDWEVTQSFFDYINTIWGPFEFDRFASFHTKKVHLFNSKFWTPGTYGIDAFDWAGYNNWLVPPIGLIPRTIQHIIQCKAYGTMIVPFWPSSVFWPLLFNVDKSFKQFVIESITFENAEGIFSERNKSVFNHKFGAPVLAIKFNTQY